MPPASLQITPFAVSTRIHRRSQTEFYRGKRVQSEQHTRRGQRHQEHRQVPSVRQPCCLRLSRQLAGRLHELQAVRQVRRLHAAQWRVSRVLQRLQRIQQNDIQKLILINAGKKTCKKVVHPISVKVWMLIGTNVDLKNSLVIANGLASGGAVHVRQLLPFRCFFFSKLFPDLVVARETNSLLHTIEPDLSLADRKL
ncbi:unnamed protein product [Ectocarpus sp. 12 AP-2014]